MNSEDSVSRSAQVNAAKRGFFVVGDSVLTVDSVARAMKAASSADSVVVVVSC
jgi:hypothetical protein